MRRRLSGGALVCLVGAMLTGCANVKLDATGASPATLEKLRTAGLRPAAVDAFALAPGLDPALDRTLPGLRGNTLAPAKGSWARLLRDTLEIELSAAGLYDPASSSVIAGELIESGVDAAIGTGTARLAARFTVTRGGEQVYERALDVEARWSSSFVGAIAIPEAINQYGALYKALVAKLIDDPDFRRALAK